MGIINKDDANRAMQSIASHSKAWVCIKDFRISGNLVKCGRFLIVSYYSKAYKDEGRSGLYCYIPSTRNAFWLKDDFDFSQFESYFKTSDVLRDAYNNYKSEVSKHEEVFDSGFRKLRIRSGLISAGVPVALLLLTLIFGSLWEPLGGLFLVAMAFSFILPAAVALVPMFGCSVAEKLFNEEVCALRSGRSSGLDGAKSKLKATISSEFDMSIDV